MPQIFQCVLIAADATKVFSALSTTQGLAGWWTPGAEATAELGSIAKFGFGPVYFKEMEITVLVPSKKLHWHCIKGADEWVGTDISFELKAGDKKSLLQSHPEIADQLGQQKSDDGTLVIFHHSGWKEYSPMFAECSYTWGRFLRSLKLYCETGKGLPWPGQHGVDSSRSD